MSEQFIFVFFNKTDICLPTITAGKVSKYGVISGLYFPVFSRNTGKYGPEILRIWTLFTQCMRLKVKVFDVKN